MDAAGWDERYRSSSALWSGEPNSRLVEEASGLPPGRALDAGCGEGADAIWLAQRGWCVTAVDFSRVALERAQAAAAHAAGDLAQRIDWLHADLTVWLPPQGQYDLVSAHFIGLEKERRAALFARLAGAVAPGGALLLVGHHPSDLTTTVRRPPRPEVFFTANQAAQALDPQEWEIVVCADKPRNATDPAGRMVTIHDAVVHARRKL